MSDAVLDRGASLLTSAARTDQVETRIPAAHPAACGFQAQSMDDESKSIAANVIIEANVIIGLARDSDQQSRLQASSGATSGMHKYILRFEVPGAPLSHRKK